MAETFTVVTQYPTVEYLGGTQTRDVVAVGYTTKPSGIYFTPDRKESHLR